MFKNSSKSKFYLPLACFLALGFSSCRGDSDSDSDDSGAEELNIPVINNLSINPANLSVTVGASVSFLAETTDDETNKIDVTSHLVWSIDPDAELFEQNSQFPFVFKAIAPGESYIFAVSKEGTIAKSKVTVFEIEEEIPEPVLANPTGFMASSDSTSSIDLAWTAADGISQHQIAYLPGSVAPATCADGIIISSALIDAALAYEVESLNTSSEYSFRICSSDGEGRLSAGISVTQTTRANHRVFVTVGTWNGLAVGGLDGADEKCQLEADLYGLTGETWKAVLSGSGIGESALARITVTRSVYNTRSLGIGGPELVATSDLDLWDSLIANAARYQANGALAGTSVWTGSSVSGGFSGANCANWSSTAGNGGRGLATSVTGTWITQGTSTCATLNRLYCIDGQ